NGARQEHIAAIESMQPYAGWDKPTSWALFILNHYGNIDKHQAVHPVFAGMEREWPQLIRIHEERISDAIIHFEFPCAGKPIHDGAKVVRVRGLATDANVKVETEIGFEIAFGETGLRVKSLPAMM